MTSVGSIRGDVSKRLLAAAAVLTLVAVACSAEASPSVDFGSGVRFVPVVADSLDDVGLGSSVAVDAQGNPYVSYLGFPKELAAGQVATQRPIGTPSVPAVMVAGIFPDGLFDRGALVMDAAAPAGVSVAFGPVVPEEGFGLTPRNSNGTALAVGGDAAVHVAYTDARGVWYARTIQGGSTSLEQVFDYGTALLNAGPIGRPAITLDGDGSPWVAYAVNGRDSTDLQVATPGDDGWVTEVAATVGRCDGCPGPGAAGIVMAGGAPVAGLIDPATSDLVVATRIDGSWTTQTIGVGTNARGLSMASTGDEAVAALYADDAVKVVVGGVVTRVAPVSLGAKMRGGNFAPTTGVAVDEQGAVSVAWQDAIGVHLASGQPGSMTPVPTATATAGGASPSLALGLDGSVLMTWYQGSSQDLLLGILGDIEVTLAQPSPSIEVQGGGGTEGCGDDGEIVLDIVAVNTAWDPVCLVAEAGKPFTINIDNQDDAAATGAHNLHLSDASGADIAANDLAPGPYQVELPVDALEVGTYPFVCDSHPIMTGVVAVIEPGG